MFNYYITFTSTPRVLIHTYTNNTYNIGRISGN